MFSVIALLPACRQKTCPCPDVIVDTQIVKIGNSVFISMFFPTTTIENRGIIAAGWTSGGFDEIVRSYFTIGSLDSIDSRFTIKSAHFVWYGDLAYYDDRIDKDTAFIYLTSAPANTIASINWNNQPTIVPGTKIPVLPPYNRVGKIKIEVTDVINRIRNKTLANNAFLFRLKTEVQYAHRSYKGASTVTPEEAPILELIMERPVEP